MPTLASYSFNKRGLILIIFGKQHQHTFKNDTHIQLSLSLYFYLLYLLLNSCDGSDAFCARETVQLVQQETPDFISPDLCLPNSPVDPETRSTIEFGDRCRNVCTFYKMHVCDTSDLMQHISVTSASMSQAVGQWRKWLCAWVKAKRNHFEYLLN